MANLSNINNKFLVTTGGNILIGTTADNGSGILQLSGAAVSQYITSTSGSQATLYIGRSVDTQAKFTSGDVAASDLCLYTGGSRRLVILSSGNVGIGTDSPAGKVEVLKNGGTSDIIVTSDTLALLQLKDSGLTKHYNIEIGRSASAGDLTFRSVSGEKVRFTEGGKVGIGTANPGQKLSVQGDSTAAAGRFTAGGNTNTLELFGNSTTGQSSGLLVNAGTNTADYAARFRNAAGSVIMNIRGDGKVGIGTTNPGEQLDTPNIVIGGTSISGTYRANSLLIDNVGGNSRFYSTGVNASTRGGYTFHVTASDGNPNDPALIIANTGNVGIGNSPATDAKLEVWNGNLRVRGDQNNYIQLTNVAGNAKVTLANAGNEGDLSLYRSNNVKTVYLSSYFTSYINPDGGNLGIGTTSPDTKLAIAGAVQYGGNGSNNGQLTTLFSASGSTQNLYNITLTEGSVWSPGIAVVNFAASRSGLQKHYAGQIIFRLTYFNGSGVEGQGGWAAPSAVGAVVAYSGQAETYMRVYVNGSNTGNPMTIQIGVRDIDDTTNYFISDIKIILRSGITNITS